MAALRSASCDPLPREGTATLSRAWHATSSSVPSSGTSAPSVPHGMLYTRTDSLLHSARSEADILSRKDSSV
eukprot:6159222-Pleurochrysis_carterae.AAC.1